MWNARSPMCGLLMGLWAGDAALAQGEGVWVQIEALPSLAEAELRAQSYDIGLDDVNGYFLGGRWYGIALGPYSRADAERLLSRLRSDRAIPADAYIVDGSRFQTQFYPVGTGAPTTPQPLPDSAAPERADADPAPAAPPPPPPDETPREAQASEALLSREEKELLQVALQWAGVYDSAIDGAFGRGTRSAMAAWQEANLFEPTGVLTTGQRAELLRQYNAVLEGMNLQVIRDDATGIEIAIPAGVVAFEAYAPPFARFTPTGDLDATVLLISQPGDQTRLFGLYEILQTLEIVPVDGPRERTDRSFTIEGRDATRHAFVTAELQGDAIKGFALIWPAGDEDRRTRVLAEMRASFLPLDGVLDPGLVSPGEEQSVDLVSGLAVRKPLRDRSGFYIDARGTVLTATEAVDGCREVVLDGAHVAEVIHRDDRLGLAVLRSDDRISPREVARFQTGVPRLQAEIAVAGYPYGGLLAAPAVTFGRIADLRGLEGEEEVKRLDIVAQPGDAGGAVLDNGGAVLGMLLPRTARAGQVLPPEVSYSVDAEEIIASLEAAGIAVEGTSSVQAITPELLTREAGNLAVLVSCWD